MNTGYEFIGSGEDALASYQLNEKYDEMNLQAFAFGAARSLTLGGSDVLARTFGLEDHIQRLAEQNPYLSTTGEISAAVLAGIFTGGVGLAGSAARWSAPGIATRISQNVVTKMGLKNKVGTFGVTGAIEGGIFGVGSYVSDSVKKKREIFSDPALVAEYVIGGAGIGLVTGGVIGGVFQGASLIGGKGVKSSKYLAEKIAKTSLYKKMGVDAEVAAARAELPKDGEPTSKLGKRLKNYLHSLSEQYPLKATGLKMGDLKFVGIKTPEQRLKFGQDVRDLNIVKAGDTIEEISEKIKIKLDKAGEDIGRLKKEFEYDLNASIKQNAKDKNIELQESYKEYDKLKFSVDEFSEEVAKQIYKPLNELRLEDSAGTIIRIKKNIELLKQDGETLDFRWFNTKKKKWTKPWTGSPEKVNYRVGVEMNKISAIIEDLSDNPVVPFSKFEDIVSREIYDPLTASVEFDSAKVLRRVRFFVNQLRKKGVRIDFRTVEDRKTGWGTKFMGIGRDHPEYTYSHWMRRVTGILTSMSMDSLDRQIANISTKYKSKAIYNIGEELKKAKKSYGVLTKFDNILDKTTGRAAVGKGLNPFSRAETIFGAGSIATGNAGWGFALSLGSKLYRERGLSTVAHISDKLRNFDSIFNAIDKTSNVMDKSIELFASSKSLDAYRRAGILLVNEKRDKEDGFIHSKKSDKNFAKRIDQLNTLSSSPAMLEKALENAVPIESEIPDTVIYSMRDSLRRGILHLNEKQPKDPFEDSRLYTGHKTQYKPSSFEKSQFNRTANLVDNPTLIFKFMGENNISKSDVDTIRYVYPKMYNRMKSEFIRELANNGDGINYQKRLQIYTLFDINSDPSLNYLSTSQALYAKPAQNERKVARPSAMKNTISTNAQTVTQRLMQ